jgi:hypothetical protein
MILKVIIEVSLFFVPKLRLNHYSNDQGRRCDQEHPNIVIAMETAKAESDATVHN